MSEEKKDYSFEERKIPEADCDHWMGAYGRQVLIDLYGTDLNGMSDVEADYYLVRYCAEQMTAKLALSRAKGRSGWHTDRCNDDQLLTMLKAHVEKGDMVDALNLAGMIMVRQESRKRQESLREHHVCLGPTGGGGAKAENVGCMPESYNWTIQTVEHGGSTR